MKKQTDRCQEALKITLHTLEEQQAGNVVSIDLQSKTAMADYMIIASGRSGRHVGALANYIVRDLKENKFKDIKVTGKPNCDWVLIDTGDIIIHIFRPEVREFYNIEAIWTVDLPKESTIIK